jgi:hypothetical protein
MGFGRPHLPGEPAQLLLRASSSGRYLVHGYSTPFFVHGYAAWEVMSLTQAEMTTFLDSMQAKGITALHVMAFVYDDGWINNGNGDNPFTGTTGGVLDFTTFRSAYWAHLDWFIEACRVRGIVVFLLPAYWGFAGSGEGVGDAGILATNGSTKLTTYGAGLGTRYAAQPNIVWVHYGDALPDAAGRTLAKAIADGIKSTDVAGRLHTSHFARPSLASDDSTIPATVNWAYSTGGSNSPRPHKQVLDGYAVSGPVPVFLGEDQYDHRSTSPILTEQQQRQQGWDAWLSGACGRFFGDMNTWSFKRLDAVDWDDHLDDIGVGQLLHLKNFFRYRRWDLLAPSTGTGLVTSGGGTVDTDGYKARALASDGSWGAVYVVDGSSTTVNKALLSGSMRISWYDPTNGAYLSLGTFANSGTQAFTPSGNNSRGGTDRVLVLETL